MWENTEKELPDLQEHVIQDKIALIPLTSWKNPVEPNWQKKHYSLKKIIHNRGNIGLKVGYNHENNGYSLAVVDIDGFRDDNHPTWKKKTAEAIWDVLKDIPNALCVETASGGKHLFLWNRTISDHFHEISKSLHFPNDFEIEELRGKSLAHSIEIFTKPNSKQVVLAGSSIKDKVTGEKRSYKVISQINEFSKVAIVDDIGEVVKKAMVSKGYAFFDDNPSNDSPVSDFKNEELKSLKTDEIDELVDLVAKIYPRIEGSKHYASLYLGGYFSNRITKRSVRKFCNSIIKKVPSIENGSAFINTILQNYDKRSNEKQAGLPSFLRLLKQYGFSQNEIDRTEFILKKNCSAIFFHDVLLNRISSAKRRYLRINYSENVCSIYNWNKTKDGEIFYTDVHDVLNLSPIKIYESYDLLNKQSSPKLCFKFFRKGMPFPQVIEGTDVEMIEKQLSKRAGLVLKPREFKGLINEIIKEYVRLDLINTVEDIGVGGIFINPLTNALARADKDGSIEIKKPTKESVKKGLKVWNRLEKVYPGDVTKLSHIIRYGIICPFSYIFKTKYEWIPLLFLYGASQTAKTTLAEIAICPFTEINDDISVGGASVDSEYRLGNALSRQGYGTIVNEPGDVINRTAILELIKRAIESEYCREKMENGIHIKIPAYSNLIFTSNALIPSQDAFIRRSEFVEFTSSERMSDLDKKEFNKEFNHINWRDTDFLNLRAVGDFIVWYVASNMDLFSKGREVFVDTVIREAYEYCGMTTPKWLFSNTELMDISSSDSEVLDNFRSLVLRDYRQLTNNSNRLIELAESSPEVHPQQVLKADDNTEANERFKSLFRVILKNHYLDYMLYQIVGGKEYIVVIATVKHAMERISQNSITCKGLADYMNAEYKAYKINGTVRKGFRMGFDEFIAFLDTGKIE